MHSKRALTWAHLVLNMLDAWTKSIVIMIRSPQYLKLEDVAYLAGEDLVKNADVFYEQPDGDAVILPHFILIARIMMLWFLSSGRFSAGTQLPSYLILSNDVFIYAGFNLQEETASTSGAEETGIKARDGPLQWFK